MAKKESDFRGKVSPESRARAEMEANTEITHITPVGGNIFADLGFEPEEAARLLAETDRIINEKLDRKNALSESLAQDTTPSKSWN